MSTSTIEKSVTINRSADEVWRFLSDENNLIKWQQSLHSHRTEENRQHQVHKVGGHRVQTHQEAQHDHQRRIRSYQGQFNTNVGVLEYEGQHTVTPAGDSASTVTTRLVWDADQLSAEGAQAMEEMAAHATEGNLMHLKHQLEAPPEVHQLLQQAHPEGESSS
jgi:uncharacterized protein YndB with AHSA1/START domain